MKYTQKLSSSNRFYVFTLCLALVLFPVSQANPQSSQGKEIAAYIETLKKNDGRGSESAVAALAKIGRPAIPALIEALGDENQGCRCAALAALTRIGESAVPLLIKATTDKNDWVREYASYSLGRIKRDDISVLIQMSKDKDEQVRLAGLRALSEVGSKARKEIPALIEDLQSPSKNIREASAFLLDSIFNDLQSEMDTLSAVNLQAGISDAEKVLKALDVTKVENAYDSKVTNAQSSVRLALSALKAKKDSQSFLQQLLEGIQKNYWILLIAVCPILYLGTLCLYPRGLLFLPTELKIPKTDIKIPLSILLFLKYQPKVLDAWVAHHANTVYKGFRYRSTVDERLTHLPIIPAVINGQSVKTVSVEDLRSPFSEQVISLLIYGEGGVGKTSLACRIANWAMTSNKAEQLSKHLMLPVLIEEELDSKVPEGKRLKETIRRQLKLLAAEKDIISEELLTYLLKERRVLVVIDRFSELSQATQAEIQAGIADIPINAVVLTSRNRKMLESITKTCIKPCALSAELLPSFVGSYIDKRRKRHLYPDTTEFLQACVQLSGMDKQREVTVLLAKLYANQMIANKEKSENFKLPGNIPDLMLNYLNELNQGKKSQGDQFSDRDVRRDAKIVAWECLKHTFQPSLAKLDTTLIALGEDIAEARLEHLAQNHLGVIQKVSPEDQIRFTLEPLAEYLAALHLLELNGASEQAWQQTLEKMEELSISAEAIQGFLSALRDCCLVKGKEFKVPGFVVERLDLQLKLKLVEISTSAI